MHPVDHVGFEINCILKSDQLLEKAIRDSTLPSRPGHIVTCICAGITLPFALVARVLSVAGNVFSMACVVLTMPCRGKVIDNLKMLGYRVTRLCLLDPVHILSVIVAGAIKVVSAVLGIIMPSIAARGYKLANLIIAYNVAIKIAVREKLVVPPQNPTITLAKIEPHVANEYLGPELALRCRNVDETRIKSQLDAEYQNAVERVAFVCKIVLQVPVIRDSKQKMTDVPATFNFLRDKTPASITDFTSADYKEFVDKTVRSCLDPRPDGDEIQKTLATVNVYNDLNFEDPKQTEALKIKRITSINEHFAQFKNTLTVRQAMPTGRDASEDEALKFLNSGIPLLQETIDKYEMSISERTGFGSVRYSR